MKFLSQFKVKTKNEMNRGEIEEIGKGKHPMSDNANKMDKEEEVRKKFWVLDNVRCQRRRRIKFPSQFEVKKEHNE